MDPHSAAKTQAEKRNEQLIGLRGGFNLNWCSALVFSSGTWPLLM